MSFQQLLGDLKKKIYAPVYFLHGEESFYIDETVDFIENNVLSESEKEFNQTVLYGKDIDVLTLISYAKRYPMMSNYQVVIVKEAQDIRNLIAKESKEGRDPFVEYLQKPTPTTILVLAYKHKTIDGRTKLAKTIAKHAIMLESKRLFEREIPGWVKQYVLSKGYRIQAKAPELLAEYLGNDLSKVTNEIGKLMVSLQPGDEITTSMVQEKIGVSKDFNTFELYSALATRNIYKANLITRYFSSNPKNNPIQMTLPSIYTFFTKVLTYHTLPGRKEKSEVAAALGINPYFVNEYEQAARVYSVPACMRNIGYLREYDQMWKGVTVSNMNESALWQELIYKLMH